MTHVDPRPAYTVTYLELLQAKADFTTLTGHMLRVADGQTALFLGWQKDVQNASRKGLVPQRVMDDFQEKKMFKTPIIPALPVVAPKAKPFTWSPSKLACFEMCPAKFAAEFFYKTVPYQESVHTVWGNRVHKAAEQFMKGEATPDAEALAVALPYLQVLDKVPGTRYVEYRIGVDEMWKPMVCPNDPKKPWDWGNAVGRMALDLAVVDGEKARLYDWKTGKMKDDNTQLLINALVFALLHPEVQTIEAKYIWLKEKKTSGITLQRAELIPVYKDIKARVTRVKVAWENEVYVSRKNGLCREWCGNTDCAFCGR